MQSKHKEEKKLERQNWFLIENIALITFSNGPNFEFNISNFS